MVVEDDQDIRNLPAVTPRIELNRDFLSLEVAIFGATISPYLFFWQTSNIVEDEISGHRLPGPGGVPRISKSYLKRLRIGTVIGMFFSNTVACFIILVAAVVLNGAGVLTIVSAADAAKALRPLGNSFPDSATWHQVIFAVDVIGIGLMSISVPSQADVQLCRS